MNQTNQLNTDLNIKTKGISNRINNEITNLFNQTNFVLCERKKNAISIKVIKDKNTYELELEKDYPFKPPINIRYNGIDYKESLFNYSEKIQKIQKILKQNYYMDCLCCNTVLCGINWTPSINICHIINEMDKITKIQKEVIIILLCNEIREKYFCSFAEFEKYLF